MSKYEIKEKMDTFIYKTYNNLTKIKFAFSKDKLLVKRNEKFKDIHVGKRCFIVGTGPSLKNLNYNYLKGEIVFGVNYLYKGDFINNIKPDYYCLYDENFYFKNLSDTVEIMEILPNTTFFLRTNALNSIKKEKINDKHIYYQSCKLFQYEDYINTNMSRLMTAPYNVVAGCIQTAIYMGFKEIYLLGSDFNSFANINLEHYYDGNNVKQRTMSLGFELKYYSMVAYHHYALEKYAKKRGILICNLTPNSLLDSYERNTIEALINRNN